MKILLKCKGKMIEFKQLEEAKFYASLCSESSVSNQILEDRRLVEFFLFIHDTDSIPSPAS